MEESLNVSSDPNAAIVGAGTPSVIAPGHTFGTVTDKISSIVLSRKTPLGWWLGFLFAFFLANVLLLSITYLLFKGTGIWASTFRSAGGSRSSTSCGGSASATPAR